MSGESPFAYSLKYNTNFIIKNITGYTAAQILAEENMVFPIPVRSPKKTIVVFDYPIYPGRTRDLLQIPGITEEDIRASLLKGVLRHKFLCADIALVYSNVDLLQFSDKQRAWLYSFGFFEGVSIGDDEIDETGIDYIRSQIGGGGSALNYELKYNISLIGLQNGQNRVFLVPDIFIDGYYFGNVFHIEVFHNGRKLLYGSEFTISESGGPGTGFNTINFLFLVPTSSSTLRVNYAVAI